MAPPVPKDLEGGRLVRTQKLLTVRQLAEECPALTESGLRWLIFNSQENKLDRALVRIGRRVLIDREMFEEWLEERRGGA